MNICIVGKYPPIQGGVSKETYWLGRGLAQRGHKVFVVTNAPEVEKRYRIYLEPEDLPWLEPVFPETSGQVTLRTTETFSHRRMSHIPLGNPFVSQLAGTAAETLRSFGCDIAFGYYLEPYGIAAHLAASWTERPYVVKHAGSDTDRLMTVPGLGESYRQVFRRADAVVTGVSLADRFLRMGITETRLAHGIGFDLPDVFSPSHSPLDINAQFSRAAAWLDYVPDSLREKKKAYDPSLPTIGLYGKIGETRGSYDLLAAMSSLKKRGSEFNLLCMVNGLGLPRFTDAIVRSNLSEETWILPFLPHWKVPGFVRACTAVCFLERDFPIGIHGPSIPREVFACGTCLIVSGEIANKQKHFFDFRSGENCFVVPDPKNHEELAAALATIISSPDRAREVGAAGTHAPVARDVNQSWIEQFERLFSGIVESRSRGNSYRFSSNEMASPEMVSPKESDSLTLRALLPWTTRLTDWWPNCVPDPKAMDAEESLRPVDVALRFCDELLKSSGGNADTAQLFRDIVQFERKVVAVAANASNDGFPFAHSDSIGDRPLSGPHSLGLRPERNKHAVTYQFEYDFNTVREALDAAPSALAGLRRGSSMVLIIPLPNCSVKRFRISPQTEVLVGLCDGSRTVEDILEYFRAGKKDVEETAQISGQVWQALSQLYDNGVIIFGSASTAGVA